MYGGGPCSTEGGEASRESRPRGKSIAAATGSAAHATTTLNAWTGSIFAFATASCGRAVSVVQQSFALSCGAHVSSPSLQHAMCDIGTDTSGAHATHNDQPNVAVTAHASVRTAAPGHLIAPDCRRRLECLSNDRRNDESSRRSGAPSCYRPAPRSKRELGR
jgi:hypothetical protein